MTWLIEPVNSTEKAGDEQSSIWCVPFWGPAIVICIRQDVLCADLCIIYSPPANS